jgi:hypothetical protein
MNFPNVSNLVVLTLILLGLPACSEPPVPPGSPTNAGYSSAGPNERSGKAAGSAGLSAAQVGGQDDDPQPEFRATRGAIQGVSEFNVVAGKKMETACAAAENAVAQGIAELADTQLLAMLKVLGSAELAELPQRQVSAVFTAVAKDLSALKDGAGSPKVVITESADKLCGAEGLCSLESPGALCHTALFPGEEALCGCAAPVEATVDSAPAEKASAPEPEAEKAEGN